MTVPQIDWIIERLSQENPDTIQITKNDTPVDTDLHRKILGHVEAWNVKRGKDKASFIKEKIPPKLAAAIAKRKEELSRVAPLGKSFAPLPLLSNLPARFEQNTALKLKENDLSGRLPQSVCKANRQAQSPI